MLRLRRILDARCTSTKDCALCLGVSEKTLYNKIVGNTDFTYGEIKKLRAMLPEYNIDYLLSEEPNLASDQDSA